jgi:glycosyltransferase involved in cell wall biosynthesis
MRIAYVCGDRGIPLLGNKGASVHLRSLAAALARRGNDVTLACARLDGPNPPPGGVRVESLPADGGRQAEWLTRLLEATRTEVVLERYSLSSGPALEAARHCGVRFVLEVNAPLVEEATRYRGLEQPQPWRDRERRLLAAADGIVAVSPAIRSHAIASGAAPETVTIVPNGADLELFRSATGQQVRQQLGLGGAVVVGFAGSLKPWHGVIDLVNAFATLAGDPRLLIVGDGPERAAIEGELIRLGLKERVVMTGAVPHATIPSYLAAMDIGVAPYREQPDFYFSPLKVAEYLAAGLPVVATAQGDLPNIVGEAGMLFAPGSVEALRAALVRLIDDPNLRARMAQAARRRAADLTWDGVAERVEGVLWVRGEKEQTLAGQIQ